MALIRGGRSETCYFGRDGGCLLGGGRLLEEIRQFALEKYSSWFVIS